MDTLTFDLNQAFPGKPNPNTFSAQVAQFNFESMRGKRVRLHGCAPTWAHLMVAAQLTRHGAAVDFLIDDGKSGIVVPICDALQGVTP